MTAQPTRAAYAREMQLQGKRVLITGASRGIGEVLAHRFAGAGARVALVAGPKTPSGRSRPNLAALPILPTSRTRPTWPP